MQSNSNRSELIVVLHHGVAHMLIGQCTGKGCPSNKPYIHAASYKVYISEGVGE